MRRTRLYRAWIRLGLPLCGWFSLALFVFAVSGLPIPVPFAKDLSRAFPCMSSHCGCRNAEQCWRSCCCHSAAERLAWAKAHAVEAPQFLVLAAHAERDSQSKPAAGRCSACAPEGCSQESLVGFSHEPRVEGIEDSVLSTQYSVLSTEQRGLTPVVLIAALKCRGVGDLVAGVPLCLPPPRFDWRPSSAPPTQMATVGHLPASPDYAPVTPPPRSPV
jgi:hypothetical protein